MDPLSKDTAGGAGLRQAAETSIAMHKATTNALQTMLTVRFLLDKRKHLPIMSPKNIF